MENQKFKEELKKLEETLKNLNKVEKEIAEILGVDDSDLEEVFVDVENDNAEDEKLELEENEEPTRALVVYKKPNFFKRNKNLILSGLAGVAIGIGLMALAQGCEQNETILPDNSEPNTIEDNEEEKIEYVTKEQYLEGVNSLKAKLKQTCNFDASLNELYSFYYVSNFENISNDLFTELVEEGYLPDRGVSILTNTLTFTGSLADINTKSDISKIDYDYIFVSESTREKAKYWQQKNNAMNNATEKEANQILEELNKTWVSADTGLPVGAKEIISHIDANNIMYKGTLRNISYSPALLEAISDLSNLAASIDQEFTCLVVNEAGKQLTK